MVNSHSVIKIAICDDHTLFRTGVKSSLHKKKDIQVEIEAENGYELLESLKKITVDIVLLDIQMPKMSGLATLPEIKKQFPLLKTIIISMHNDTSAVSKMMEIGANAYLTKESGSELIYEAIKMVHEREFYFNELTNEALLNNLRTKRISELSLQDAQLTDKEITILQLICMEKSIKEISKLIDISPRTVEAICDKLKVKTGTKSIAGLVIYAVKTGLVDQDGKETSAYNLSKKDMIKLFSLSTSILAYVNHDLAGQRNSIFHALSLIKEEFKFGININDLTKKGQDAITTISAIINVIRSHFYWKNSGEISSFDKLFVSKPVDVIDILKQRYKDVIIDIFEEADKSLEIIYPPQILIAILSELTGNAKKNAQKELKILLNWRVTKDVFQLEIHDNGSGFPKLGDNEIVSLELFETWSNKELGIGLHTIDRTIFDSGGHLHFSNSKKLRGALVYFEFPVINYKKTKATNDIYNLSREQMARLFKLSTSILAYINHDLLTQKDRLFNVFIDIKECTKKDEKNRYSTDGTIEINDLLEKALDAVATIGSITNLIKSHFHLPARYDATDFNKLFISRPLELVNIIRERYKDAKIQIRGNLQNTSELVYPPQILMAILSELIENAKKATKIDFELIIILDIVGSKFQCEVHDSGPGFLGIVDKKFVPLESIPVGEKGKSSGMGLGIINRTVLDSGGHLFFSKSKFLNGAAVYFEFPLIDYNPKIL